MTLLHEVPDHAIRTLTAERNQDSRSFLVTLVCLCGASYSGVTVSQFSGVLDVGLQVFFTHLAAEGAEGAET